MGLNKCLLPEHPRPGSTDDVQGIVAFLHRLLEPIFDEKDSMMPFQKLSMSAPRNVIQTCPFITTLEPMTDTRMVNYNNSP
jgi:hypothetical protein